MWTRGHQLRSIGAGKKLRVITAAPANVHWSPDAWQTTNDSKTTHTGLGCSFVDLATSDLRAGAEVVFTFQWSEGWEGKNYTVTIIDSPAD
jgi:hypothetical protein